MKRIASLVLILFFCVTLSASEKGADATPTTSYPKIKSEFSVKSIFYGSMVIVTPLMCAYKMEVPWYFAVPVYLCFAHIIKSYNKAPRIVSPEDQQDKIDIELAKKFLNVEKDEMTVTQASREASDYHATLSRALKSSTNYRIKKEIERLLIGLYEIASLSHVDKDSVLFDKHQLEISRFHPPAAVSIAPTVLSLTLSVKPIIFSAAPSVAPATSPRGTINFRKQLYDFRVHEGGAWQSQ